MDKVIKNIPIVLVISLVLKVIIKGSQFADAPIIIVLCALWAFNEYKQYNKEAIQVQEDIKKLNADLISYKKEIEETRSYVSGVKLASSMGLRK